MRPVYIHRYSLTLRAGRANARSLRGAVDGFLLRWGDGYGCVQPWPELGDPPVDELLALLRAGQGHALLARALACAEADGAARRDGRSLFHLRDRSGLTDRIPRSHATVTGEADFPALAAAGFSTVKLKTHAADGTLVERLRAAAEAGLRVRVDCNGTGSAGLSALRPWAEAIDYIEDPEPYVEARWRALGRELGMRLALDRHAGAEGCGYAVRVLKPALESCRVRALPAVITTSMDHPLGQMFAAWEAARYPGAQLEAGLLTHHLFEPDAFTEAVLAEGAQLFPAAGTGLGFDALLEALPWVRLTPPPAVLHLNPRAPMAEVPALPDGAHVFPTSGSTGAASLICLSPAALMANAGAVNDWLEATADDVWLRVLPDFHVGGAGIAWRAALSGSRVVADEEKWDAARFVQLIAAHGVTLTSLVPAQVHDLVAAGLPAPAGLRAVITGGGRLELALCDKARALGWPLLPSYGMTETASQVATARPGGDGALHLLPCWEARVTADGRLQLRGAPLLSGHLVKGPDGWAEVPAVDGDGWFTTADRVQLDGRILTPLGRCDRVVKILGELVDLDALEAALHRAGLPPERGVIMTVPDARAGCRPVLVTDMEEAEQFTAAANASLPPYAIITAIRRQALPRSPLGKVLRAQITPPEA